MVSLDLVDDATKAKILGIWKTMGEAEKNHFINQVALALSIWGSDEPGRMLVIDLLEVMAQNGTTTLADFGLYVERLVDEEPADATDKIRRAAIVLEGYRIKNALSSEPHHEIG